MKSKTTYTTFTDEQLCAHLFMGESKACEVLLERYMPLVRSRAGALSLPGCEKEDLVQEGLLAMVNAMRSYDPEAGASFKTFAYICVTNRMLTERKRIRRDTSALNELDYYSNRQNQDPCDLLSSNELLSNEALSKLEQHAFRLYLDGYTYREMAASLQSTTKAVDNALQRARKKLRIHIAHTNFLECKPLSVAEIMPNSCEPKKYGL